MPTGYDAYPAAADLKEFLKPVMTSLGLSLPGAINYQQRIDSARQKIEGQIGRRLLASSQTLRFDPPTNPRCRIDFGTDVLSVSSLTVQGVAYTEGTDFLLEPFNNPIDGKPYRWLEFIGRYPWPDLPQIRRSVIVVAMVGFALQVPTLGFDAILAQGALDCVPEIALLISKGRQMLKEGDVEEMFARGQNSGPLQTEAALWQQRVMDGINNLTCVEVGL